MKNQFHHKNKIIMLIMIRSTLTAIFSKSIRPITNLWPDLDSAFQNLLKIHTEFQKTYFEHTDKNGFFSSFSNFHMLCFFTVNRLKYVTVYEFFTVRISFLR